MKKQGIAYALPAGYPAGLGHKALILNIMAV